MCEVVMFVMCHVIVQFCPVLCSRDIPMMPNPSPVQENCDSHLSSSLSAVMGDSISPTNITLSLPSARQLDSSSNRSTPSWRLSEPPSVTQSPIAGYRFSIGQLPKWAKVKVGMQCGGGGDFFESHSSDSFVNVQWNSFSVFMFPLLL